MEKFRLWLTIAWKYIVLGLVIVGGIVAAVLMIRFMSPRSNNEIEDKIKGLKDEIKTHKDNLRNIDDYLNKHGVR